MACSQGADLTTEELLTYISESSTMSKSIEEYEGDHGCLCRVSKSATSAWLSNNSTNPNSSCSQASNSADDRQPGLWLQAWYHPARVLCSPGRKSCAITTARRLGQFLGDERIKDKGLNCNYVVARRPEVAV